MTLLRVQSLIAGYGLLDVLRDVTIEVEAGELVAVLGPNGAGKTTLLRSISGIKTLVRSGSISFDGVNARLAKPQQLVRSGLAHVAEGRQLFPTLSVDDHLKLGTIGHRVSRRHEIERMYELFPRLRERKHFRSATLSGGEQQALAIARALVGRPKLLMIDEPTTGLAPKIVAEMFRTIRELVNDGMAALMVEQNAALSLKVADRAYVLEQGAISLQGNAKTLLESPRVREAYLGARSEPAIAERRDSSTR